MAETKKAQKYYKTVQEIVALTFIKKDGQTSKVAKGKTHDGKVVTVIPVGTGNYRVIVEVVQDKPWPGQRSDGTWIVDSATVTTV